MSTDETPEADRDVSSPVELHDRINTLIAAYKATPSARNLDELLDVLVIAPAMLPDRAHVLSQLSAARLARFRIRGDAADLVGAVESARSSLALTDPGPSLDRRVRQVNLGAALLEVAGRRGTAAELDEGIELLQKASAELPAGSEERSVALANLCDGLQLLAERTSDPQRLMDAIAVGKEAVAAVSDASGERAATLTNYANALRQYAHRTAEWSSLDSAIEYHRSAVSEASAEDPRSLGYSNDFAIALYSRFELRGESNDLDEAIAVLQNIVSRSARDDPNLGSRLTNLSVVLRLRFKDFGDVEFLRAACEKAREAVAVTPLDDEKLPGRLSNFASTLLEYYGASGESARLQEGVDAFRRALDLLPGGYALRPVILTNLANALRSRAYAFDHLDDLTEAFVLGKEALLSVTPGDPLMANCAYNLAMILQAVYSLSTERKLLDAAIDLVRTTAMDATAPVAVRLTTARAWGEWAGEEIREHRAYLADAAEGYAAAASLLPTLAWRGLQRTSQERLLAERSDLPGLAAAYATEAGLAEYAISFLELGRSVIWGQLLDIRTDLDRLRRINSDLAFRMTFVRTQLDQLSADPVRERGLI